MFGLDDARRKIEAILEGKEDEKLFGGEDKEEERKEKNTVTVKETEEKEMAKEKKKEWYGIHVSGEIQGKRIVKNIGLVYVTAMSSSDNKKIREDLDNLIKNIIAQAQKKGANAIINFRFAIGSYDHDWSQWSVMQPIIYGEAVIVE